MGGPNGTTGQQFEARVYGTENGYYPKNSSEFSNLAITFGSLINTTIYGIYNGVIYVGSNHRYAYDVSEYVGNDTIRVVPPLFTAGMETVNFDSLLPAQKQAISAGSNVYESLGGGDTIVLPDASAAANLGETGVSFDPTHIFRTGDGSSTVTGGDLGYHLLLGAGTNNVTLGNGSNTVADYIIFPTAIANNNVAVGTGSNNITLGSGNNFVGVAAGGTTSTDNIVVGNGTNYVYGGTSTTTITAGTGQNTLVSNSAMTTLTASGSSTTFQVVNGNTINGFASGDFIDVQVPDPSEQIDTSVISTDGVNTYIRTFDTVDFHTVTTTTLTSVYQPSNFFGSQIIGSKDYLHLSYSGQNPTTVFQNIETGVFDALSVIDKTLGLAKNFAQGLLKTKTRDNLLADLQDVTVRFPSPVLKFAKLSYDLASATTSFALGDLTAEQYEVAFAKALIDVDPTGLGSKVATIGSFIISKWIDYYFAAIDESQSEPTTAVVPIRQVLTSVTPTLNSANASTLSAALALRAQGGDVAQTTSPMGPFPSPTAGQINIAVATGLPDGAVLSLPSGYDAVIAEGGGAVTLSDAGTTGAILVGNDGADTLLSSGQDVTLVGGKGRSTFVVSGGATIAAGDGNNLVQVSGTSETGITTGTGANRLELFGGASNVQSNGSDTILADGTASTIQLTGNSIVVGGSGLVNVQGGGGSTTVFAGSGQLTYQGETGQDIVVAGGGGAETVNAGAANVLLFGGFASLVFNAGSGVSTVVGGTGGNTVTGGYGPLLYFGSGETTYTPGTAVDTVLGFTGSLTATGGPSGTLFFTGTAGGSNVLSGSGSSTIVGFGTNDTLTAMGSGNDVIEAAAAAETINAAQSSGANTFFAFGQSDVVVGGAGSTAIESFLGDQTLIAGSGSTLFEIVDSGTRAITLDNFDARHDFVQFQGYAAAVSAAALSNATVSGGNETLALNDGTQVTFLGVNNLSASSFL